MAVLAFWLAARLLWAGPPHYQLPHGGDAQVNSGRALFRRSCSGCHGDDARGGRGSDLTSGQWKWGGADRDILRSITQGIPGTQMPPFPMPEDEAKAILSFLRSVQTLSENEAASGDAQAGRQLFFNDSFQCSRCHVFGGQGGRLGPDLSAIRDERNASQLRKAILEPDESLRDGFQTIEVEFHNGKVLRGVAKNQDTFSLQMMAEDEKLYLLIKKDLKRVTKVHRSLMPAVGLNSSELEDIVAFLLKDSVSQASTTSGKRTFWTPATDLNVSFERIKHADQEPRNWLTYGGDYRGTHFSRLTQITPANVQTLKSEWAFQYQASNVIEATPIVVDGLMFVTGPLNDVVALDARVGRKVWTYNRRIPSNVHSNCTVMTNRGVAILGDRLYLATLDSHLVALDSKTGSVIWEVPVDDYRKGYSITHAPLALDGKIVVGVTSGECALVGFLDAYDATTGARLWRFWTVPQKGDPARATWAGDSAEYGGSPTWMTGTYDAETRTLFWTTGNPGPDYDGTVRAGDNLYTCSVLALNPDTGSLKWYFQFTPHDTHDWDANETPVLIDAEFQGRPRKLLIQANRNGFYYVLDRVTGEFLLGKPFGNQTWAEGLDAKGRPLVKPGTDPTPEGSYLCPNAGGNTNWQSPSYDTGRGLFYVAGVESCATYFRETKPPEPGASYSGGSVQIDTRIGSPGFIRALNALTGEIVWNFDLHVGSYAAGVLGTAGGVLFGASEDGYLIALDAKTGRKLWHFQTGSRIASSPISYEMDGKQMVAVSTSTTLLVFALP
ncbi:MAG: PQQ-dependent dehydrogenase, methanol/ethanol family [Acidobacteriota bacterium]